MPTENTTLRINANRAGTVKEITDYLFDLENAYNCLYVFDDFLGVVSPNSYSRRRSKFFFYELGLSLAPNFKLDNSNEFLLPEHRMVISKINIQSPGFWEVLGTLNPLQQIREYLNDRHSRGKDLRWREQSEKEKAMLENELIQRQIFEADNRTMKERISIFRDLGFSDQEIRQIIWTNVGKPLMELGKHQDNGLIEGTE
ncbi:hypothetical protein [Spirosoma montaniterrae]|nr:hypothetical protein [Spirosoma montaniterrae]